MPIPKLLIADSNTEFIHALEACFAGRFSLRSCTDGTQAMDQLRLFRPDILLMDLVLPGMDGLCLLQQIDREQLPVKTLVLTGLRSRYISNALQQLPVDYMMLKPCNLPALSQRVTDMASELITVPAPLPEPKTWISHILVAMGFSAKVSGFRYLQAAVPMYAADSRQAITKELYAAIGEQFQKNAQLVERAIRAAIDTAWRQRDDRIWKLYCRTAHDGSIPRPSNGDLIASLAQILNAQLEGKTGT